MLPPTLLSPKKAIGLMVLILVLVNLYFAPLNLLYRRHQRGGVLQTFDSLNTRFLPQDKNSSQIYQNIIQLLHQLPKNSNRDEISRALVTIQQHLNLPLNQTLLYDIKTLIEKQGENEARLLENLKTETLEIFKNVKLAIGSGGGGKIDNLTLEKLDIKDMMDVLSKRDEKKEAVYFTETSGTGTIKARFVCSVESAARAYYDADIYLVVGFLPSEGLLVSKNEQLVFMLKHYKNVQVLNVDIPRLFKGSPLDNLYYSGRLNQSRFPAAHFSDMIRALIVYNYGGKYFDLDVMTVKRLPHKHFAVYESNLPGYGMVNAAFGFSKGHLVGKYMFEEVNNTYKPDDWAYNGPRVLTEGLKKYTGVPSAMLMNAENMKGFVKMRYESFLPIEWFELQMYMDEAKSNATMERLRKTEDLWAMHIGNNILKYTKVNVGSTQAYSLLAQKYCPRSYWSCYQEF